MTDKRLQGIDGVLGNLISARYQATDRRLNVAQEDHRSSKPLLAELQPKHVNSQSARLGRPPGKPGDGRSPKEKATVRISSSLIAEYRDRSWEARCSLSGLVERAMIEYQRRFHE